MLKLSISSRIGSRKITTFCCEFKIWIFKIMFQLCTQIALSILGLFSRLTDLVDMTKQKLVITHTRSIITGLVTNLPVTDY